MRAGDDLTVDGVEYITASVAAKRLGVSAQTIRNYATNGRLRSRQHHVGKRTYVVVAEAEVAALASGRFDLAASLHQQNPSGQVDGTDQDGLRTRVRELELLSAAQSAVITRLLMAGEAEAAAARLMSEAHLKHSAAQEQLREALRELGTMVNSFALPSDTRGLA